MPLKMPPINPASHFGINETACLPPASLVLTQVCWLLCLPPVVVAVGGSTSKMTTVQQNPSSGPGTSSTSSTTRGTPPDGRLPTPPQPPEENNPEPRVAPDDTDEAPDDTDEAPEETEDTEETEQPVDPVVLISAPPQRHDVVFSRPLPALQLAENQDGSSAAIVLAMISATDDDADSIAYSLSGAHSDWHIDAATGQLSYRGGGLNYETTNKVQLVVIATSDGADGTPTPVQQTITVQVLDQDDAGRLSALPASVSVGTVLTRPKLVDEDSPRAVKWVWQVSRDDGKTWQDISGGTGPSFTPTVAQAGYQVRAQVLYDDNFGNGKTLTSDGVAVTPPADSFDVVALNWYPERLPIETDQPVAVVRAVFAALQPSDYITYHIKSGAGDTLFLVGDNSPGGHTQPPDANGDGLVAVYFRADQTNPDFETKASYAYTLVAQHMRDNKVIGENEHALTFDLKNIFGPPDDRLVPGSGDDAHRFSATDGLWYADDGLTTTVFDARQMAIAERMLS